MDVGGSSPSGPTVDMSRDIVHTVSRDFFMLWGFDVPVIVPVFGL